jgi:enoyl-CoA hydratase/carnithine racemase
MPEQSNAGTAWTVSQGVGVVALDGADGNMFDARLGEDLWRILRDVDAEHVRCVVIMGSETVFARGTGRGTPDARRQASLAIEAAHALSMPCIALVRGEASGLGCELALACDLRVASRTAWFSLPYVQEGLVPAGGASQRLPRLVGLGRTMDMLLTGRTVLAAEAHAWGLVDRLLDDDVVQTEALELATGLAKLAPIAESYAKEAIVRGSELPWDDAMRLEMDLSLLLHSTEDRATGIDAFQRRERPTFTGR